MRLTNRFRRIVRIPANRGSHPACRECGYLASDLWKIVRHVESEHGLTATEKESETRTVRRCGYCGYPLGSAFEVPVSSENMYSNYTIACDWCTKTIHSALADSPFGIRKCSCGHDLCEHEDSGDEDDLPMPCSECECKDWREKKKEAPA